MKKKLNLVLRDPVKLHKNEQNVAELPAMFEKKIVEDAPRKELIENEIGIQNNELEERKANKKDLEIQKEKNAKSQSKIDLEDVRKTMSLRIKQVWEYFCVKANADNELKNSFTVTRAEVMREAGIGSTNTYREALKRMQGLGLIRIELRPGVNAGSVFYLTDEGLEQAQLVLEEI